MKRSFRTAVAMWMKAGMTAHRALRPIIDHRARLVLSVLLLACFMSMWIAAEAQIEEPVLIDVDRIGIAFVNVTGFFVGSEAIPCVGEPLYVYSFYPEDLVIYLDLEKNHLLLVSPTEEVVGYNVSYVTYISRPVGDGAWELRAYLPFKSIIILPEGSTVTHTKPPPSQVSKIEGRTALLMEAGEVLINYAFALPPSPEGGIPSPTTPPPTATQPAAEEARGYSWAYIAIAAAVTLALSSYLVLSRTKKVKETKENIEEYLDDRDKAIIQYLRERGSATPSELIEAIGIPKSAFYRRVSRLEKLGFIEIVDLGVKKVYRLRREQ